MNVEYWPFRAHVDRRKYVAYMRKSWLVENRDAHRRLNKSVRVAGRDLAAALPAFVKRWLAS